MEKIVCALWSGDVGREAFNAGLISALPAALHLAGASHIRLNLRDASVDPGTALIQRWQEPQQDAVLQFWLPSANAIFRAEIDRLVHAFHASYEYVPTSGGDYTVNHTAITYLVDRDGKVVDIIGYGNPHDRTVAQLRAFLS